MNNTLKLEVIDLENLSLVHGGAESDSYLGACVVGTGVGAIMGATAIASPLGPAAVAVGAGAGCVLGMAAHGLDRRSAK